MTKQKSQRAFAWTDRTEQAAVHVAQDFLSDEAIAARLKITRRTLTRWKQIAEFKERVAALRAGFREVAEREGVALVGNRLQRYNRDWRRLEEIKNARAREAAEKQAAFDALMQAALERGDTPEQICKLAQDNRWPVVYAGMETGLLVRTVRHMGRTTVEEVAVDTGLLAEQRAIEIQAAKELGQWTERKDVTSGGKPIQSGLALEELSDDEIDRRLAEARRGEAPAALPG